MTPPISIGSQVEVTGPGYGGYRHTDKLGKKFKIAEMKLEKNEIYFTGPCFPWYPASSLRLVDEALKIGDFVEIVGQDVNGN